MSIVILKFEPRYRDGKREDWVLYAPKHSVQSAQTWDKVSRMRPPEELKHDNHGIKAKHMHAIWSVMGPAYEAWLKGQDLPEQGIPLATWPGVDEGQALELAKHSIRTVEDVAEMTDGQLQKIQLPNVREIRKQAKAYMDSREGVELAQKVTEQDNEIATLREQLEAAMEMLKEQAEDKPKRGRPKKAEAA